MQIQGERVRLAYTERESDRQTDRDREKGATRYKKRSNRFRRELTDTGRDLTTRNRVELTDTDTKRE